MVLNKNELVKKLKYHFGLNIYESKVYVALLYKKIASVGEIAEVSGVPRSRVYDVLESLEKQGFAVIKLGKPVKYIAVKPGIVIENMRNNLAKETEDKIKLMSTIKDTQEYKELESIHNNNVQLTNLPDLGSAIKGRQNIYTHLKDVLSTAQKEVILVTETNALKNKLFFLKPIFEELKKKGVSIKVAASSSLEDSEKESLHLSKELGVPVRKVKLNTRVCLIDGSKMLMFLNPHDEEEENDSAIWINSEYFSKAMLTFLNPIWKK